MEPCPRHSRKSGRWFYFGHTEKCYLLTDEDVTPNLEEREVCTKYGNDIGIIKAIQYFNSLTCVLPF